MRLVVQLTAEPTAPSGPRRRFRIVPEDTRFDARLRPGPPGGVQISGVTGEFSAVEGPDGLFDLSHPVEGSFSLQVAELDLGNRILTFAVRQWLGSRPVQGRLGEARPLDDGTYLMELFMELRGREHLLEGTGSVDAPDGDRSVLHGGMTVKPADIGLHVPGFLVPTTDLTWAIVLEMLD